MLGSSIGLLSPSLPLSCARCALLFLRPAHVQAPGSKPQDNSCIMGGARSAGRVEALSCQPTSDPRLNRYVITPHPAVARHASPASYICVSHAINTGNTHVHAHTHTPTPHTRTPLFGVGTHAHAQRGDMKCRDNRKREKDIDKGLEGEA
jgi:hypothetical protein